jgi:8-oxo-dGTP pyrophosphatase MutT (NUDIX family)
MINESGTTLTTSLVLLHPSQPRLLCIHHPTFGRWMFPGGRVDHGEAPHETVLREVVEELCLEVHLCDPSPLPAWDDGANRRLPHPFAIIKETVPGTRNDAAFIDFVFVGVPVHDRFTLRAEVSRASWCNRDEIAALETTYPIKGLAEAAFDAEARLRATIYPPG